jgi:hypothetical protein
MLVRGWANGFVGRVERGGAGAVMDAAAPPRFFWSHGCTAAPLPPPPSSVFVTQGPLPIANASPPTLVCPLLAVGGSTEGLPSFFDMDTFGDDGGGGSLPAFFTLEDDTAVPAVAPPPAAAAAGPYGQMGAGASGGDGEDGTCEE